MASLTGAAAFTSGIDDTNDYSGLLGNETGWGPRRQPASNGLPSMGIGQVTRTGDLDAAIIRRYVKRNLMKLQQCYDKQRQSTGGVVVAKFHITPSGTVVGAEAGGVDPGVSSCVAGVLAAIEFPKPKGGNEVVVEKLPLTYTPGKKK